MEESAKRKERLKAMRVEADQSNEASRNSDNSPFQPSNLSNPFAEPSSTLPVQGASPASAARFDFYTDPMAAFSGQKRKMNESVQNSPNQFSPSFNAPSSPASRPPSSLPGPGNFDMTPSPSQQFQKSYSPGQRMYEAPSPYHGSGPWMSPSAIPGHQGTPPGVRPFPGHQGTPPAARPFPGHQTTPPGARPFPGHQGAPPPGTWNNPRHQGTPPSGAWNSPIPGHQGTPPGAWNRPAQGHQGTPPGAWNSPVRGHQGTPPPGAWNSPVPGHQRTPPPRAWNSSFQGNQGTSAGAWDGSGDTGGRGYPSNSSRVGGFNSTGFGRGGSPNPNSGRGSGYRYNSPGAGSGQVGGRGRGRGRGSGHNVSARERPDLFYNKSMVEDPWKNLVPGVRKVALPAESLKTPDSLKSWLPKSIRNKENKVSGASKGSSSRLTLAEYLAASFEEAAGNVKHSDDTKDPGSGL